MRKLAWMILVVGALAGCGPSSQKAEGYKRWYQARAKMLLGLAEEHLEFGQLDKALNRAQEALTLDPGFPRGRLVMAMILIEQGRNPRAIEILDGLEGEAALSPEVTYFRGVALEREGRFEEALHNYRKARALNPRNIAAVTAVGEVLVLLGRTTEAREYIGGYLPEARREPALHELAGHLAMKAGEYESATRHFRNAVDADYENLRYREALARAQHLCGRNDEAVETLKVLASMEGYEVSVREQNLLGDCYLALGEALLARDAYYTARRLSDENDVASWIGVAKSALALKDPARAVLAARQALVLSKDSHEAAEVLGYALILSNQAPQAVAALGEATRRHPDNDVLRCLLGQALEATGQTRSARRCYEAALRLDPDSRLAQALLARATTR